MLTKKDFIAKAKELAKIGNPTIRESKIKSYVRVATTYNPAFDEGRFRGFINEEMAGKKPSNVLAYPKKTKWIKTDDWRGYKQPITAIVGASDTGTWSDSPSPTPDVNREMEMIKKELAQAGVPTREVVSQSSNAFMGKRWLITPKKYYLAGKKKSAQLLKKLEKQTSFIHGAD